MTDEKIINYCKLHKINYLGTTKKVYKRNTLIRNIMKSSLPVEKVKDEIKEIEYINKVIWTLEKKQDTNENYKKINENLNRVVKKCHDYYRGFTNYKMN